jgi:hypothetical protein
MRPLIYNKTGVWKPAFLPRLRKAVPFLVRFGCPEAEKGSTIGGAKHASDSPVPCMNRLSSFGLPIMIHHGILMLSMRSPGRVCTQIDAADYYRR